MVLYLRQTAYPETNLMSSSILSLDSTFYDFESLDVPSSAPALDIYYRDPPGSPSPVHVPPKPILHAKHSVNSVNSGGTTSSSPIPISPDAFVFNKTHMSLMKSSLSLNIHIGKFAGRIIYYLSGSNWPAVFHRLRTKVNFLSSSAEDNPDTVDLELMTHSVMDRSKLVQVLQGMLDRAVSMHSPLNACAVLSSLLVNMKRQAQAAVALSLRRAIWNWIDIFPDEFNEALRSRGRMEGAPERTFDLLHVMQQGAEKAVWPTLTLLNCISSERLSSDFQINHFGSGHFAGQKGSHRKVRDLSPVDCHVILLSFVLLGLSIYRGTHKKCEHNLQVR